MLPLANRKDEGSGVSVLICCYNSANRIGAVLNTLKRQQRGIPWEVVLVDNNSTDDTANTARLAWGLTDIPLRIIQVQKPGQAYARAGAAEAAAFPYLTFIDDDNLPCGTWIRSVQALFTAHPEVGVIGARAEIAVPYPLPDWFAWHASAYAVGPQASRDGFLPAGQWVYGAGLSIRKVAWQGLISQGFTPLLTGRQGGRPSSGDDAELVLALQISGWKTYYSHDLKLGHAIAANRLNYSTLEEMIFAFGRADIYLSIYRAYLLQKKESVSGRIRAFLLLNARAQLCYRIAKICGVWLKEKTRPNGRRKSELRLVRLRSRGYLAELKEARADLDSVQAARLSLLARLSRCT